ncbi:MAG: penicillin-binding protein 2 [Opitutales bacterium]
MKNTSLITPFRFYLFIILTTLGFVAVSANLVYLQAYKSEHYLSIIEKSRNRTETIPARRGDIYDSRNNLLATTTPYVEIGVDPTQVSEKDMLFAGEFADIVGLSKEEILESYKKETMMREDGSFVEKQWRRVCDIDMQAYEKLKELKLDCLCPAIRYKRIYPSGALTSHVIGYVNKSFNAVCGIELMLDFYLRGQDGWREIVLNGKRREIMQFRQREQDSVDGMNVVSSIDIVMQEAANQELTKIVSQHNPKGASIIISDTSGFILAMANYPNFDPNASKTDLDALRNRAITDRIEPGSTFKIIPVSAALNEQYISPNDVFDCKSPTVSYKGRILKLPSDTHLYENLSVKEIIQKSSNRGSAHIAMILGEDKLYSYAKDFGFGQSTHLGLNGETSGTLHSVNKWDGLTITRLPMGHAVDATPLQIHCAMSVIACGGVYMKPQLIKEIKPANGDETMVFNAKPLRRVVSQKTASLMSDMLSEVTQSGGTATRAAVDGFKVAGKTGTTQKIINGAYSSKHHVASFSGFFPADRPRIIITVIIDDPNSSTLSAGYGGVSAAPVFSSLARTAASYYGIQRDGTDGKAMVWTSSR